MTYSKFKKELCNGVQKKIGDSYKVEIVPNIQNNSRGREAVCIRVADFNGIEMSPLVYLDELYDIYCKYRSLDHAVSAVIETYERHGGMGLNGMAVDFNHWTAVKDFVYPALLSLQWNKGLLDHLVSDQMLDLAIIYIIRTGEIAVKVTHELFTRWGISQYKLHEQAMDNLNRADYRLSDMQKSLLALLGDSKGMQAEKLEPDHMYVLTNETDFYGASMILKADLLRNLAEGRNLFIMPTCVHEVVLIPDNGKMVRDKILDMQRFVNGMAVETDERLSDHAYYYEADRDEIRIYS